MKSRRPEMERVVDGVQVVEDRRLGELDEGRPVPGVIGIQQVAKVIAKLDDLNGINSNGATDGLLFPPSNDF